MVGGGGRCATAAATAATAAATRAHLALRLVVERERLANDVRADEIGELEAGAAHRGGGLEDRREQQRALRTREEVRVRRQLIQAVDAARVCRVRLDATFPADKLDVGAADARRVGVGHRLPLANEALLKRRAQLRGQLDALRLLCEARERRADQEVAVLARVDNLRVQPYCRRAHALQQCRARHGRRRRGRGGGRVDVGRRVGRATGRARQPAATGTADLRAWAPTRGQQ